MADYPQVFWIFHRWKNTRAGHLKWDEFKLKLPVFGKLNQMASVGRFCRLLAQMLAAGEKAGKVEDMLSSVADSYDEEVEMMLATLTALMEPFLMVFLGVVIGTIVAAMFMPIFNMGSLAS